MSEALCNNRVDWQIRHLHWLLERIVGSTEDKEQFLDMWSVAMTQRHVEGTLDALDIVKRVHTQYPCSQTKVLVKALSDLAALNKVTY